jgi:hypothetical protein
MKCQHVLLLPFCFGSIRQKKNLYTRESMKESLLSAAV